MENPKKDKNNEFPSYKENKNIIQEEIKSQIGYFKYKSKINSENNSISSNEYNKSKENIIYQTESYTLLHGKLAIKWGREIKKSLQNYSKIKRLKQLDFYGKEINKVYENQEIKDIKGNLIGIFMVFKNCLDKRYIDSFDKDFSVSIKSYEKDYITERTNNKGDKVFGKLLYIGGDLTTKLSDLMEKKFKNAKINDNSLPLFLSIMLYNEYEYIDLDAYRLCGKETEQYGFTQGNKFHKNFVKDFSRKIRNINSTIKSNIEELKNKGKIKEK